MSFWGENVPPSDGQVGVAIWYFSKFCLLALGVRANIGP